MFSSMMMTEDIRVVLLRDLTAVKRQVEMYPSDEALWHVPKGTANSAGNLAVHLAGNLRHFIGAHLGGSGYVRDRTREFTVRGLTRAAVAQEIEAAIEEVGETLERLPEVDLSSQYPLQVAGGHLSTGRFLIHLAAHLGYHLGQIDYHRRILTESSGATGAVGLATIVD